MHKTNSKIEALAKYLEIDAQEITTGSDDSTFDAGNQEWIVLTEEEADEKAKELILDLLWAFNTNYILLHSRLDDWNDRTEKAFQKMQETLCEGANEIVKAVISDLDEFVEDAITADGRGHFISGYDGEEYEQDDYYLYRTN